MKHNLFKPKNLEDGKHAVVGDCNGIPMAQRYEVETPLFAKAITELSKKADVAHPQILDYGCGVGRLAKEILKEDSMCDVRGIDASSEMIDLAYSNVGSSRFLACLPGQLGKEDIFDLAYCVYVLQHVPAIEMREILSRIYRHLKDDGIFVYCSSDYRMAIRFDNPGFFDDRFLGVNIQEEIARFFDLQGPLFDQQTLDANPILKTMIQGGGGLPHPALIYKKKDISKAPVIDIPEMAKKLGAAAGRITNKKLLLINRLAPGDILVMTNAIRDLHRAYPGVYQTDVRSPCPEIFENNPQITKLEYDEGKYQEINAMFSKLQNRGESKEDHLAELNDILVIDMHYPSIHRSGMSGEHFGQGHTQWLEEVLGVSIPQTSILPEFYLSAAEKNEKLSEKLGISGKYWVMNAGSKGDYTLKQYPYFQEVVDLLVAKGIQVVQIGNSSHQHSALKGSINLIGKTNIRQLAQIINESEGVITCVSLPMHLAAAFVKPCVVVPGAREGTRWELYPNQQFLYVNGCLPCASYDGCWKSRVEDCYNKIDGIPRCMTLVTPEDVVRAVERYYQGGMLKKEIIAPVILDLKEKEIKKMEEVIVATESKTGTLSDTMHSNQVDSAIFNTLRILKKINPADTYLEAYKWHYNKRKESFMDLYHYLWFLGSTLKPKRILEIGTRTGLSICQLLSSYIDHNEIEKIVLCDLFNDGLATPELVMNNLKHLNIPVEDKVEFIIGNSLEKIPLYMKNYPGQEFDMILVDGGHEKDTARQDLLNAVELIAPNGYILFDDISIDGCDLKDVWGEFKVMFAGDFSFFENYDGKGLGVAVRNG